MREGIGSVFLYNIIIIFIVITFAFILGIMSYAKAFRVNSKLVNAIETYEGYNELSAKEIARTLNNYGYKKGTIDCPNRNGKQSLETITSYGNYQYCVYAYTIDNNHYNYGVLTYMNLDLPIIGKLINIPVFAKTDTIYYFTIDNKNIGGWIE